MVLLEIVKVNQPDRGVLTLRTERERSLSGEPRSKLLVRVDQAIGARTHHDRPQAIKNIVGMVGLGGYLGV